MIEIILENSKNYRKQIPIHHNRTCDCKSNHINCLTAKDWLKGQIGIWRFAYEGRDIRDKKMHPATFPIALSKKVIELFTHEGELVLDPFVGSGTTLVAAKDLSRNAVGFDLRREYITLCASRIDNESTATQVAVEDNAMGISNYLKKESVQLIWTSPPYSNLLNRKRKNKSMRNRKNEQFNKIEQYSHDPEDLGTMEPKEWQKAMGDVFEGLLPLLRPKGHVMINIGDIWWENERITLHMGLIEELRERGYEFRNTIIWDKTPLVNKVGIFGWPNNYITMGVTFEYLLHFQKKERG